MPLISRISVFPNVPEEVKLHSSYLFFSTMPDTEAILSTLHNLTSSSPQLSPTGKDRCHYITGK